MKNYKEIFLMKNLNVYLIWFFSICIYTLININIHMHESYVYAGSMESFFDTRETLLGVSPWLSDYNNFGIYHPNHPLLHLFGYWVKWGAGLLDLQFTAIQIVSTINTFLGIIGVLFFYKTLLFFTTEKLFATLSAMILMFSDIYWYSAKSGEGYVAGQCFNLISVYYLFLFLGEKKLRYLVFQSIFLGISISIHSLFSFMILPQFVICYQSRAKSDKLGLGKVSLVVFSIVFLIGLVSYILPLYFHVGAKSFSEMVRVFLVYSDEMGVWTKNFSNSAGKVNKFFLEPLLSGFYHLMFSILDGIGVISLFLKVFLGIFWFWSARYVLKQKNSYLTFFKIWFLVYFVFNCYVIFLPYIITYWIFLLPAFVFIIFFSLLKSKYKVHIVTLMLIVFLLNNFFTDIYPKHKVNLDSHFQLPKIANEVRESSKLLIVIFDSFGETAYLNYFGIIWAMKNSLLFEKFEIQIIVDNNEIDKKLLTLLNKDRTKFYVFRNVPYDLRELNKLDSALEKNNYYKIKDTKINYHYNSRTDKTSEFHHVKKWYDLGPVNQSWSMNLSLYAPK